MPTTPIALILGAGPRVGAAVAQAFSSKGYKIALASRKGTNTQDSDGFLSLQADFEQPNSIPLVFEAIKKNFNAPPSVVVYNAAGMTPPPEKDDVFSIPAARFEADLNVNVVSAYVAAQEAAKAWETLPGEGNKTFIYTGNVLNTMVLPMPMMVDLGVGKAASAYWIGVADAAYSGRGYRFFYGDEHHADGKMKGMQLDGEAHGEFYTQLAENPKDVPWHATFVKGKGYVKF